MKRLVLATTALLFVFAAVPSARADEIDDAVAMFTADDGLTAAEKLPALKALIEEHKDNPKVEKLKAVLKGLAAEAGESTVGAAGNNSSAVAAGDLSTTTEPSEADAAPEVELPPVKISTPEEIEAGFAARGAAKDMGGKMLPAIKSRIDSLKRLEGMAGKHGKALSKSQSHDLKRLEAAYDRYNRIHSKLDKIGKGELPPEDWDDTIKTATGGLTISEMLGELGDIFVSLSRK